MQIRVGLLETKVARRILLLFAVGAALPVLTMTALTYRATSNQLREQGEDQLMRLAGISSQSVLERLATFESLLRSTATIAASAKSEVLEAPSMAPGPPPAGVLGLALQTDRSMVLLAGATRAWPDPSPGQDERLRSGQPVLSVERSERSEEVVIILGVPLLTEGGPPTAVAWAAIAGDSIWSPAVTLSASPSIEDVCILDGSGLPLFCGADGESRLPTLASAAVRGERVSGLEMAGGADDLLFAWRDVFLRPAFGVPSWTVVIAESRTSVYSASSSLRYNLGLASLIGISAVLLLSNFLIRRTMEPLSALTVGTRRLAERELEARVPVESDDEFGALASSFNRMAEHLDLQFKQLEAGQTIDRSAMSGTDPADSIAALVAGVASIVPSTRRAVLLAEPASDEASSLYVSEEGSAEISRTVHVGEEARTVARHVPSEPRVISSLDDVPYPFRPLLKEGSGLPMMVLPLRVDGRLIGAVSVIGTGDRTLDDEDGRRAQYLVDRAAVAIAKVRLDRDLASMSWESLSALANAIDAKSPWTTGHSERVTELSLLLGHELGLSEAESDLLHRGGLLHDIGKIAVPTSILDFDGPLDDEMRARIQEHPAAGERILAPIRLFQPILPIVRSHHEHWDGAGYPDGLRGEDIDPMARLLAVADVFDAMVSPRPYRPGLDPVFVHQQIREAAGTQFDPDMVVALDKVMAAGWSPR